METEKILSRIQKLLAKAASTDSIEERESFMLKAQQLLQEYNLDMSHVENLEAKQEGIIEEKTNYEDEWERILLHRISICNFCKTMSFPSENKISIIGKNSNIGVVIYLYKFFHHTLLEMSIKSYMQMCKEKLEGMQPSKKIKQSFLKEYLLGGVNGIYDKMKEQKSNAASNIQAVMVINDKKVEEYFNIAYPNTKNMKAVKIASNSNAYGRGYSDGKNINSYNAVTSGAKQIK